MKGVLYHLFDHSLLCAALHKKVKIGLMVNLFISGELFQRVGLPGIVSECYLPCSAVRAFAAQCKQPGSFQRT